MKFKNLKPGMIVYYDNDDGYKEYLFVRSFHSERILDCECFSKSYEEDDNYQYQFWDMMVGDSENITNINMFDFDESLKAKQLTDFSIIFDSIFEDSE